MPLNAKQVRELVKERRESSQTSRQANAEYAAAGVAYFNGKHWRAPNKRFDRTPGEKFKTNYDPNSRNMRVTDNFVTPLTELAFAATHPLQLPIDVTPFEHDITPKSRSLALLCEQLLRRELGPMHSIDAIQNSNFMAAITGGWLIVLELNRRMLRGGNDRSPVTLGDWSIHWRTCPATDLILDPANSNRNLALHEEVMIQQVYTARKFNDLFGDKVRVNADDAATIGQLVPEYAKTGQIDDSTLYAHYLRHSKTKGVMVYFMYRKSNPGSDRFDEWYIVADVPMSDGRQRELRLINTNEIQNPFGAHGLPIGLVNYYLRPGHVVGRGATHQMMGVQDLHNLSTTLYTLGLAFSAVPQWIIDKRTMSQEEYERQTGNGIGQPIFYRSLTSTPGKTMPPQSIRTADPSPAHLERMRELPLRARDSVHRSALHQGIGKSHVPDVTTQALLRETDKVPTILVEEQARVYADLLRVSLGTMRRAVDAGGASMLARWSKRGFRAEDLVTFKELDPDFINLDVRVPRDAIRPRSPFQRRQEIVEAADPQLGLLTRDEANYALAVDAEMPLTSYLRDAVAAAQRAAQRIIAGEEWEGLPAIDHSMYLSAFRHAMNNLSDREESARQRLARAIQTQRRMRADEAAEEQALTDGTQASTPPRAGGLSATSLVNPAASPNPSAIVA